MTAPGQVPAPETIEVAPVESFPRARTEISTWRLHAPEGVGGDAADWRGTQIALSTALSSVFNPARDRILWETMAADRSPSAPWGNTSDEHATSHPAKSNDTSLAPIGFIPVPRGASLSLALGMALARRNLHQEHWIAAVTSMESLLRRLTHDLIEQLQQVESRLLLVVVDDGRPPAPASPHLLYASSAAGQFDQLDSRWLSELGLPCRVLDMNRGPAPLLTELQQIAQGRSPSLVHLRIPTPPLVRSDLPTESSVRGTLRLFGQATPLETSSRSPCLMVIADELRTLAEVDPRVVAVVQEDLWSSFAVDRWQSTQNIILRADDHAALTRLQGLALGGCRPFVVLTSHFVQQSLDHLTEQLSASNQSITLLIEADAQRPLTDDVRNSPHTSDLAYLRLLPSTIVAVPSSEQDLRCLLRWSLQSASPVAIHLPRGFLAAGCTQVDSGGDEAIELGRAIVHQDGEDIALFALGPQINLAARAADRLSAQGLSVAVINARFLNPIDQCLLRKMAAKVGGIVTLEDEPAHGGLGTVVLEQLAVDGMSTPVLVLESGRTDSQSGDEADVENRIDRLVERILEFVDGPLSPADRRRRSTDLTRELKLNAPKLRETLDRFGYSEDSLRLERELVKSRELCPSVAVWASTYERVGHRSRYLWRWCERGAELTTLPCVLPEFFDDVWQTKVLSIILCVLLDDVADRHGQERFLNALLQIVETPDPTVPAGLTDEEIRYAEVTCELTRIYYKRIRRYPCHDVYQDLLQFDLLQFFNALRYSHLLNRRPSMLNVVEHDLYLPHNMHMMSFATLDLMCSPSFSTNELGRLREAVWHAQCMGRIGNLLASWRRECVQHDFTSGVFARAVVTGDLSLDQLCIGDPPTIETAIRDGGHERYFFRRWQHHKRCFSQLADEIRSIDLVQLLDGHERFLLMHLGSRGLI